MVRKMKKRRPVFRVHEKVELPIGELDRDDKIDLHNEIAIDNRHNRVSFNKDFIHESDVLIVESGEWEVEEYEITLEEDGNHENPINS